ncbi:hypothetical protein [Bacillus sp. NA_165.1]|uniref:hypothetical protein n=1 Tax=unclassified Bacillus (in: firmicutes) TaxID=185979 RepID=UPI004045428E
MREHIEKARTIQKEATEKYLELQKELQGDIEKVKADPTLSEIGRTGKIEELQKEHGQKLIEFAKQLKNEYQIEVIRAKGSAERFLEKPNNKPSDFKVQLFEQGFTDLKTRIMLSLNSTRAIELISEFVKGIDDAYLANQLRNQFTELISHVIQYVDVSEGARVKADLLKIYSKLETDFITDEQNEARQIIDEAEVMFGTNLFNSIVIDSVREFYRHNFADYINKPDMYVYAEGTK